MEKLTSADYRYLYGKLNTSKLPKDLFDKAMCGGEFTDDEEDRIKRIIEEDRKNGTEKDHKLTSADYRYLYNKLDTSKLPEDLLDKAMHGGYFTNEEEDRIKKIIEEDRKIRKRS